MARRVLAETTSREVPSEDPPAPRYGLRSRTKVMNSGAVRIAVESIAPIEGVVDENQVNNKQSWPKKHQSKARRVLMEAEEPDQDAQIQQNVTPPGLAAVPEEKSTLAEAFAPAPKAAARTMKEKKSSVSQPAPGDNAQDNNQDNIAPAHRVSRLEAAKMEAAKAWEGAKSLGANTVKPLSRLEQMKADATNDAGDNCNSTGSNKPIAPSSTQESSSLEDTFRPAPKAAARTMKEKESSVSKPAPGDNAQDNNQDNIAPAHRVSRLEAAKMEAAKAWEGAESLGANTVKPLSRLEQMKAGNEEHKENDAPNEARMSRLEAAKANAYENWDGGLGQGMIKRPAKLGFRGQQMPQ